MRRLPRLLGCIRHGFGRAEAVLARVHALPDISVDQLLGGSPAVILAPHPDDESLGCGGLIAAAPDAVKLVFVTNGAGLPGAPPMLAERRRGEALAAAAVLGVAAANVEFWDCPDGAAPGSGPAARALGDRVAALAARSGAKTILATWDYDPHPDHVATYRYARRAAQRTGAALFAYPVWALMLAGRSIVPDLRPAGGTLRLGPLLEIKRRAVLQHRSQIAALQNEGDRAFGLTGQHLDTMITGAEAFIACNGTARARLRQPATP